MTLIFPGDFCFQVTFAFWVTKTFWFGHFRHFGLVIGHFGFYQWKFLVRHFGWIYPLDISDFYIGSNGWRTDQMDASRSWITLLAISFDLTDWFTSFLNLHHWHYLSYTESNLYSIYIKNFIVLQLLNSPSLLIWLHHWLGYLSTLLIWLHHLQFDWW